MLIFWDYGCPGGSGFSRISLTPRPLSSRRGGSSGENAAEVHRNYCVNALVLECLSEAGAVIADIMGLRMSRRVRILRRGMGLWFYGSMGLRKGADIIGCLDYEIITERTEIAETYGNGRKDRSPALPE